MLSILRTTAPKACLCCWERGKEIDAGEVLISELKSWTRGRSRIQSTNGDRTPGSHRYKKSEVNRFNNRKF